MLYFARHDDLAGIIAGSRQQCLFYSQESFMAASGSQSDSQQIREIAPGFDLDVTLLEIVDPGALVNVTNDNCGSTCGACTTGVS